MTRRGVASWVGFALAIALGCAALRASEEKPAVSAPATPGASESPPDISAESKAAEPEKPAEGRKTAERFGLDLTSNAPLEINSKSFEMLEEGKGGERLRFRGDVKLKQGELELRCERLDAFYPEGAGAGRPQSLVASGDVQIVKGEFELRCTRATFEDANCIAVCLSSESCKSGRWPEQPARFKRGKDWIEGRELEFNQCTGKLFARCGARLQVAPQPKDKEQAPPAAAKPAAAPRAASAATESKAASESDAPRAAGASTAPKPEAESPEP